MSRKMSLKHITPTKQTLHPFHRSYWTHIDPYTLIYKMKIMIHKSEYLQNNIQFKKHLLL